jgi:hypothetical protein
MKIRHVFGGIAAVLLIGGWFVAGAVNALFACRDTVTGEYPAPDGRYKAVVFRRDCGATTDSSTYVSIVGSAAGVGDTEGNLFTADGDHGGAPLTLAGVLEIRFR